MLHDLRVAMPKQHSMWAPVGPQLGTVGPRLGPGWARLGPIWECCLGGVLAGKDF